MDIETTFAFGAFLLVCFLVGLVLRLLMNRGKAIQKKQKEAAEQDWKQDFSEERRNWNENNY